MGNIASQVCIRGKGLLVQPPCDCILYPWMPKAELEFMKRLGLDDLSEITEL